MNLNAFNWIYRKSYYFKHPIKWFKELLSNIRAVYRRARYGYCYSDVWNFNDWFCSVIPPMLRHMADKGMGYPGSKPFDTPEKWHTWLYKTADTLERLGYDDWMEDMNEYSADYNKSFEGDWRSEEHEEIRKKYYERCKEIHELRAEVLENFGKEFFKYFDAIWD